MTYIVSFEPFPERGGVGKEGGREKGGGGKEGGGEEWWREEGGWAVVPRVVFDVAIRRI